MNRTWIIDVIGFYSDKSRIYLICIEYISKFIKIQKCKEIDISDKIIKFLNDEKPYRLIHDDTYFFKLPEVNEAIKLNVKKDNSYISEQYAYLLDKNIRKIKEFMDNSGSAEEFAELYNNEDLLEIYDKTYSPLQVFENKKLYNELKHIKYLKRSRYRIGVHVRKRLNNENIIYSKKIYTIMKRYGEYYKINDDNGDIYHYKYLKIVGKNDKK